MSAVEYNLDYYTSDKGIFVANRTKSFGNTRMLLPRNSLINGKELQETHSVGWYFVEGESIVLSLEIKESDKRELVGYELTDPSLEVKDKIKPFFAKEEVNPYWCEVKEEEVWTNYDNLRVLYNPVYKIIEGVYQSHPVNAKLLGSIEGDIGKPLTTTFSIPKENSWGRDVTSVKISSIAHYSEIDQILVPDFAIHQRPCFLTSKDSYNIVRTFIKDNIDPKQAAITSDYDFCFAVKKKVAVKPWINKKEVLTSKGKSYRKPKYKQETIEHKLVEVFEMTSEENSYKGYTPIKGFKGESLEDLVENINRYLDELINFINSPVSECGHCEGTGHIINKDVPNYVG